ncbi:MAG: hypothetical protein AB1744_02125 [Candidatus Zixiibacteriota bacterium]
MTILKYKTGILLGLAVALVSALLVTVNYTDACRLESVVVNGEPVKRWESRFAMLRPRSLVRQPLDSLVQALLSDRQTFRVDVRCSWPHTFEVTTNAFLPVCLLLDNTSGCLYGLEKNGRVVPLENALTDYKQPVVTGVSVRRMYDYCTDSRVVTLVEQLEQLRRNTMPLFRMLEEVNLQQADQVQVRVAGLPFPLKARADRLCEDLHRFVDFVSYFDVDLSGVREVDLRFDDLVICAEGTK